MEQQKKPRFPLALSTLALGLTAAGIAGIGFKLTHQLTHPKRRNISQPPSTSKLAYEEIIVHTSDDLTIRGWFLPAQSDEHHQLPSQQTIIFAHHYGGARSSDEHGTLRFFAHFLPRGYNVISFDFRNSGISEGDLTTVGADEDKDLAAIVQWCNQKIPHGQIILMGFSMGAAVVLKSGWQFPNVVGVIADSSFKDLQLLCYEALPFWAPFVVNYSKYIFKIPVEKVQPIEGIKRYEQRPILLIHALQDPFIRVHHAVDLYKEANPDCTQLCIIPCYEHGHAYFANEQLYLYRVFRWLDHYFPYQKGVNEL